jgi:Transposase IS116/IS110/IS902 family
MHAISRVVDRVAGVQHMLDPIERQSQSTGRDGDVLARAWCMSGERTRVDPGLHCRPHELKLHARQDGGEHPALPTAPIGRNGLLVPSNHNHPVIALLAQDTPNARVQGCRDPIEHQNGWHLLATLDRRQHARTDLRETTQSLKRQTPSFPLAAHAATDCNRIKRPGPGALHRHSAETTLKCIALIRGWRGGRAPGLLSLYCVGPDTAALLLIAVGDQPERLRSEAAWAHLCGVAPIPASSGKTRPHRLNRGGNREANYALWRIVITRLSAHPATRAYVERRTADLQGSDARGCRSGATAASH